MDRSDIFTTAKFYADRVGDADLTDAKLDKWIELIEAKVNRRLDTLEMSTVDIIAGVADQQYYDLPSDYGKTEDLKLRLVSSGAETTYGYLSPELINTVPSDSEGKFYTITKGKLRIAPTTDSDYEIDHYYTQHLPALTSSNTTNWLGDTWPDVYVYGLTMHICVYAKNAGAVKIYKELFEEALKEVEIDNDMRWPGGAPVTQVL